MSLHEELLEQAGRLIGAEGEMASQADLRRSVSSAYYALFHLLAWEFASFYAKQAALAAKLVRTLDHIEMKRTSERFIPSPAKLPSALAEFRSIGDAETWDALGRVARLFVDLQRSRHDADYNLAKAFERSEVANIVESAREAFRYWSQIRDTDWARIYLACFQHWKTWDAARD